ncbi:lysostaphin resistance A-like protein [Staphylococcus simulans]
MQFELNQSMKQTQKEWGNKSPWIAIIIAVVALFVSDFISTFLSLPLMISQKSLSTQAGQLIDTFMNLGNFVVILIVLLLTNKFILKKSTGSLGFYKQNWIKQYGLGAAIGSVMLIVVYLLSLLIGGTQTVFNPDASALIIFGYLIGFLIQGMTEEVLTRSLIMNVFSAKKGIVYGVIINSIFFSLMHGLNPGVDILALINLFLAGLFFSLLFYWSGSIWVAGAAHSLWNFVQGPILGVKVSGAGMPNTLLSTDLFENRALLNGGNFGLEGGLLDTLVSIVVCVILWKLCQRKGLIH